MSISNRNWVKAWLFKCFLIVQLLTSFQPSSFMTNAFYVPGVAPQDFSVGDLVDVKVNFSFIKAYSLNSVQFGSIQFLF